MQDSAHFKQDPIYLQLPHGNNFHNGSHAYDDVIKQLQDAIENNRLVSFPGTRTNMLYIAITHYKSKNPNGQELLETVLKYFCQEHLMDGFPGNDPIKLLSTTISHTKPKTLLGYLGTDLHLEHRNAIMHIFHSLGILSKLPEVKKWNPELAEELSERAVPRAKRKRQIEKPNTAAKKRKKKPPTSQAVSKEKFSSPQFSAISQPAGNYNSYFFNPFFVPYQPVLYHTPFQPLPAISPHMFAVSPYGFQLPANETHNPILPPAPSSISETTLLPKTPTQLPKPIPLRKPTALPETLKPILRTAVILTQQGAFKSRIRSESARSADSSSAILKKADAPSALQGCLPVRE